MNVRPVACTHSVLASLPPCSGSSRSPVPNGRPTSCRWYSQGRALFLLFLVLIAFPVSVSAAPPPLTPDVHIDGIHPRQGQNPPSSSSSNNSDSQNNGSISMSVWLPILLVSIVFVLFSFVTCVRRCASADAAATSTTSANRAGSTPANGNTTRPRRRPHRTPSQISTKSLPPYMKEPGDQELVLFGGPSEMEDDPAPPHTMPTLAEDDEEHPEMRSATFDIALDRIESMDTMADSSTTNLIRRVSASVPTRPPELHYATMPQENRRSGDAHSLGSVGSDADLLDAHQRGVSVDNSADPRGEAPSYTVAVSEEGGMTTISLNDPVPNNVSSSAVVPPSLEAGRGLSRFSFLMQNPFSSHSHTSGAPSHVNQPSPSTRSESPALHMRSGSALSRHSTHESHESHSRPPSRNHHLSRSRSGSNSNLLRGLRSHSPGLHAGSSTISLDSISAPLTHTLTRAEFHAPKGGLMTAEQIKLITSREALERFGVPYGPDAVAASRERLAEMGPPPDFESLTGEHQGLGSGSAGSATEATAPRSTQPSLSHQVDERSRASTYATAAEVDGDGSQGQVVQTYGSEDEGEMDGADEPGTARPMTPRTARP